jgi:hypothetical protein
VVDQNNQVRLAALDNSYAFTNGFGSNDPVWRSSKETFEYAASNGKARVSRITGIRHSDVRETLVELQAGLNNVARGIDDTYSPEVRTLVRDRINTAQGHLDYMKQMDWGKM